MCGVCGSGGVLRGGVWNRSREGRSLEKGFLSHPSGCRYPDSRPLFCVAVHDGYIEDSIFDVCVGACACLPPSVDEGSTHVSVCEARTVQLVNTNRSSYAIVGSVRQPGDLSLSAHGTWVLF